MNQFTYCDTLDAKHIGRRVAGQDAVSANQIEDSSNPLHPLHSFMNTQHFYDHNNAHLNFGYLRYNLDRLSAAPVSSFILHLLKHQYI